MLFDADHVGSDTEFTEVLFTVLDVLTQEVLQEKRLASGIGSGDRSDVAKESGGDGFEDFMDDFKDRWRTITEDYISHGGLYISKPIMVNGQYHIFVDNSVISCNTLKTDISDNLYNRYLQERAEEEAKRAEEKARAEAAREWKELFEELKELTEDELNECTEIFAYYMDYILLGLPDISQETFEENLNSKLEKFYSKLKNNHKNWNWNKLTAN